MGDVGMKNIRQTIREKINDEWEDLVIMNEEISESNWGVGREMFFRLGWIGMGNPEVTMKKEKWWRDMYDLFGFKLRGDI